MQRLSRTVSLLAVTALLVTVLSCQGAAEVKAAKKRVHAVLYGMEAGGSGLAGDLATPMCQWFKGANLIANEEEKRRAADAFEKWKGQKGLGDRISSFAITAAEVEPDSDPTAVIVSVTIDGKPHKLRVLEGQPITWTK